ncbi:hypothetical protein LVY72_09535 [Arthrobacter sp. I2-34]|uniref:Uncharacterized protein n=1 Tax=Arthrobacter hankyongi TaxID=2904801 RepID=A0ABS9L668_9MICC|nr:hypothetical protein [Arthrobacter hankyongi]MCG2622159.1 hypothetical protein [Arthrobacter hankyongi]
MFTEESALLDWIQFLLWGLALVSFVVFLVSSDALALSHPKGNRVVDDKERFRTMVISGWVAGLSVMIAYVLAVAATSSTY